MMRQTLWVEESYESFLISFVKRGTAKGKDRLHLPVGNKAPYKEKQHRLNSYTQFE